MAKMDHRGRTKTPVNFIMLRYDIVKSPAYRDLSVADRAIYTEIQLRYNSYNNGEISLSCREAANLCKVSPGTAARAFQSLLQHGFIRIGRDAAFNMKQRKARRWILTHLAIGEAKAAPSNEWKEWKPKIKSLKHGSISDTNSLITITDGLLEIPEFTH